MVKKKKKRKEKNSKVHGGYRLKEAYLKWLEIIIQDGPDRALKLD